RVPTVLVVIVRTTRTPKSCSRADRSSMSLCFCDSTVLIRALNSLGLRLIASNALSESSTTIVISIDDIGCPFNLAAARAFAWSLASANSPSHRAGDMVLFCADGCRQTLHSMPTPIVEQPSDLLVRCSHCAESAIGTRYGVYKPA